MAAMPRRPSGFELVASRSGRARAVTDEEEPEIELPPGSLRDWEEAIKTIAKAARHERRVSRYPRKCFT